MGVIKNRKPTCRRLCGGLPDTRYREQLLKREMSNPRVSIGMPVYNGANFIRCSLQSLLAQDYQDFELIISDNGSTDETEWICRQLAQSDGRIRYFRNDINYGASWNFNNVFRLARGQFFKWAAHDDECHPTMLRRCIEVLERAPDRVAMVYPLAELIDEQGKTLQSPLDRIELRDPRPHRRLAHALSSMCFCDPLFGIFKVEYLKKTQLWGPFFGADNVLMAELAMLGEVWELDEVLFRLRAHPKRATTANGSARAVAVWYDSAAARKWFVIPTWEEMVWRLFKAVHRSSLSHAEKLRCWLFIPGYYRSKLKNRLRTRLKALLGAGENANAWPSFVRRVG
jgi:glycosyltransferase involved in cell wall biosynthesis